VAGSRETFVLDQVEGLQPFDFVVVALPDDPFSAVEVSRDEDGALQVRVAPRPPTLPFTAEQLATLDRIGFAAGDPFWLLAPAPADTASAVAVLERTLTGVFDAGDATPVDLTHGSRRSEHEASLKLAALRERIEPLLADILGHPPTKDEDGDYVFDHESTRVFVAPRAVPGVPVLIRVFAITNFAVSMTPELGLFLARLNFGLMFGRFALDTEHRAVWFSETLLGEQVSDEEFRFTVGIVAQTANEWDDRIAQMFGGMTHGSAVREEQDQVPPKPGEGGYL